MDAALVRETCYNYIYDACPVMASMGPIEQLADYNQFKSKLYWMKL